MSAVPARPSLRPPAASPTLAQSQRPARRPRGGRAGGDRRSCWRAASTSPRCPQADVVWGWIAASLAPQPRLGRRQGDRLEGGARRAARPAPRALRPRRAGALHRLPAQHGAVRPCRRARARRGAGAAQAAGRREHSCFDDRRHRAWPSSSCSASRWRSRSSRSRRCMHLPHMIWQLVIAFVLVLAVASRRLMIVMRSARGRLAAADLGPLAQGQALFSRPRATALAMAAGDALLGRADRRHLGGARGLPHPRRPGRRRPRLRLLDDRAAVPVLARQPRHLPARRRAGRSSAPTRSRPPARSPSASASSSSRACSASASGSCSWPARASR